MLLPATVLFMSAPIAPAHSAEPHWPKEPYKYLVVDQDVRDVLREFGRNIRVPVQVSESVTKRRIRNDIAVGTPREFLQRLCEAYGLVWYYDGSVLHIADENEQRAELFNIGSISTSDFIGRLDNLGVTDARFPIRASGRTGVISVSGPPAFRQQVRKALDAMQKADIPPGVTVFRGSR